MKKISLFLLLSMELFSSIVHAGERDINSAWCEGKGIVEFRTKDGTYVDCLTATYAIEAEFDNKWKEAIGQSLHYAETTGRKPAILLIKRKKSRKDYHGQLQRVIDEFKLKIKVFVFKL